MGFVTVLDYVEQTAARVPDKTAFRDTVEEITFGKLVHQARCIASGIASVSAQTIPVAFFMDKSVQAVVGFLGAAYAGCPYSLINTRYPISRIQSIVDTLAPQLIVTDEAHKKGLEGLEFSGFVLLESELRKPEPDEMLLCSRRQALLDTDPLYINFTSGSTGVPKGVTISHRNVCDFIPCFLDTFGINEQDVFANQAPFDFDVSVKDIYSGLFSGASVEIIPTNYFLDPEVLLDFICDRKATIMVWAVSALCFLTTMNAFEYRIPERIRYIMFSGEVLPIKHLKKLKKYLPDVQYVNLYGPTEITCNCTYYRLNRDFDDGESIPIGRAFSNERVFLLDEADLPVTAADTVGELCVSGACVGLGYYGRADLTEKVFVQNPLNHQYREIIYRTGDLAKWNQHGELLYIGRKDFQIKHKGHRIELNEIELQLSTIDGIDRAVCLYHQEKGRIVAFYCGEVTKQAIKEKLKQKLPDYMIPNVFVQLDSMPVTKNGKIDRAKLRERM